jgi:hypothetical protein
MEGVQRGDSQQAGARPHGQLRCITFVRVRAAVSSQTQPGRIMHDHSFSPDAVNEHIDEGIIHLPYSRCAHVAPVQPRLRNGETGHAKSPSVDFQLLWVRPVVLSLSAVRRPCRAPRSRREGRNASSSASRSIASPQSRFFAHSSANPSPPGIESIFFLFLPRLCRGLRSLRSLRFVSLHRFTVRCARCACLVWRGEWLS